MKTRITTLERIIFESFKLSVQDFHNEFIEIEEDFRACMYFHLRTLLQKYEGISILLSHNLETTNKVIRPDISIIENDTYRVVIELKNINKTINGYADFSLKKAKDDIKKLESYSDSYERGFFIYFTKRRSKISPRIARWKIGYYRELYHSVEKAGVHYLEFGKDGYKSSKWKIASY